MLFVQHDLIKTDGKNLQKKKQTKTNHGTLNSKHQELTGQARQMSMKSQHEIRCDNSQLTDLLLTETETEREETGELNTGEWTVKVMISPPLLPPHSMTFLHSLTVKAHINRHYINSDAHECLQCTHTYIRPYMIIIHSTPSPPLPLYTHHTHTHTHTLSLSPFLFHTCT